MSDWQFQSATATFMCRSCHWHQRAWFPRTWQAQDVADWVMRVCAGRGGGGQLCVVQCIRCSPIYPSGASFITFIECFGSERLKTQHTHAHMCTQTPWDPGEAGYSASKEIREKYIPVKYYRNLNTHRLFLLLASKNHNLIINTASYIYEAFEKRKECFRIVWNVFVKYFACLCVKCFVSEWA